MKPYRALRLFSTVFFLFGVLGAILGVGMILGSLCLVASPNSPTVGLLLSGVGLFAASVSSWFLASLADVALEIVERLRAVQDSLKGQ